MGARVDAPSSLERTQIECQALKQTHHALDPSMRGASFPETELHPLELTFLRLSRPCAELGS